MDPKRLGRNLLEDTTVLGVDRLLDGSNLGGGVLVRGKNDGHRHGGERGGEDDSRDGHGGGVHGGS